MTDVSYEDRLKAALSALADAIFNGEEYPDASHEICSIFDVTAEDLQIEYDNEDCLRAWGTGR